MPYPLPDGGPPYTEDLRWFLVAVPDDTAFVRAALGAYTEFTKYWMWGHEGKEPGRNEATQVWEGAIAATLEALEMGFPDILLGHIDEVETLLQSLLDKSVCCPATGIEDVVTDWQDIVGDEIDTSGSEVVVGVGDPPAGAADWTQFQSKLCDGASKYADGLIAMVDNFAIIQGLLSGLTLATLGAFIASFLPILGVSVVAAGVVVTALGLLGKLDELQDLVEPVSGWDEMRTALSDARQDIICAIITSNTAAQAAAKVQTVIEDIDPNIWAWIRFFTIPTIVIQRIFNMESDAAGGYGGGCGTCGFDDYTFVAEWDLTYGSPDIGWTYAGYTRPGSANYVDNKLLGIQYGTSAFGEILATWGTTVDQAGYTLPEDPYKATITRIETDYYVGTGWSAGNHVLGWRLRDEANQLVVHNLEESSGQHTNYVISPNQEVWIGSGGTLGFYTLGTVYINSNEGAAYIQGVRVYVRIELI